MQVGVQGGLVIKVRVDNGTIVALYNVFCCDWQELNNSQPWTLSYTLKIKHEHLKSLAQRKLGQMHVTPSKAVYDKANVEQFAKHNV